MAISYSKVNWDTSKYVNPTNMNQMDNGIKAACDGVDTLNAQMGTTSISSIGDGTVTGAIKSVSDKATPTTTAWTISSSFIPRVTFTPVFSNVYKVGNVVFVNLRLTIDAQLEAGGLYMLPQQLPISNYSKITGSYTLDGASSGSILQDGNSLVSSCWCRTPNGVELQVSDAIGKTIWLDFQYLTNE